jgi:uncharacterized protein DUF4339
MSAPASQPWFLARDGQQFGPISEPEMAKLVELGHLQSTDLLWREGFPDWRPALVVFPSRGPALSRGPTLTPPPTGGMEPPDRFVNDPVALGQVRPEEGQARPRRGGRVIAFLLLAILVAGGGAAGYTYREQLTTQLTELSTLAASFTAASGAMSVADRKSLETPPLIGFRAGTAEAIDAGLQATALWRVVKREFPDWYGQRLAEAVSLAKENKDDAVIGQLMARKLVELRRQQVANGLSAKLPMLKAVANAYYETLDKLRAHSVEACSGFIRQGEAEPLIVALLQKQGSEHTAHLQALATAVFEAIADGRQVPRVYPQPSPAQYSILANELAKKGWTPEDFRVLSSKQTMAEAEPEKVCQLVHDFFQAQLALPDPEAQERLLVDSLRPVFAG